MDDKEKSLLLDLAKFCDITWYKTKEQWLPNAGKYPYIREFPEESPGHCAIYYETDESNPICWDLSDPISKNTIAMKLLESKIWYYDLVLRKSFDTKKFGMFYLSNSFWAVKPAFDNPADAVIEMARQWIEMEG